MTCLFLDCFGFFVAALLGARDHRLCRKTFFLVGATRHAVPFLLRNFKLFVDCYKMFAAKMSLSTEKDKWGAQYLQDEETIRLTYQARMTGKDLVAVLR